MDNWKESAACRGCTDLMYANNNNEIPLALSICGECPVRAECLADCMALEDRASRFGVCGGLTAGDRYRLAGQKPPRRRYWRAA